MRDSIILRFDEETGLWYNLENIQQYVIINKGWLGKQIDLSLEDYRKIVLNKARTYFESYDNVKVIERVGAHYDCQYMIIWLNGDWIIN